MYLGANQQNYAVKANSNQSSNKENKFFKADSNLNFTNNHTSLQIDDIQEARTGHADNSMNDELLHDSKIHDTFCNNESLSKRKYITKDSEINTRQSEKRLKIERNTPESKDLSKLRSYQLDNEALLCSNSNSESWNNNIVISKTQVKLTDFFRPRNEKKLGDASPIFGNFEKKKDIGKIKENFVSKNLKLQFLNFNSDNLNREIIGEQSFEFSKINQGYQPCLAKQNSAFNNLSRANACQDTYI